MKKRLTKHTHALSFLLAMCMLITYFPVITVSAMNLAGSYTYSIYVKIADEKYAGTDSDIYAVVKTHNGITREQKIDTPKYNDFERNSGKSYNVSLDVQPWEISEVGIKNAGSDKMKVSYYEFTLPSGKKIKKTLNKWFEKSTASASVASDTRRTVSGVDGFDSFDGTLYYDANVTTGTSVSKEWSGKITDDYASNYKCFDYYGATGITLSASGKGEVSGKSASYDLKWLKDNGILQEKTNSGYVVGYDIDTNKLLSKMSSNNIYKFTVTSKLSFNSSGDNGRDYEKTLTFIRKKFMLGNPEVTTNAYIPKKDNNFFNSGYSEVTLKVPVQTKSHYNASNIATSIINKNSADIRLYYGNVSSEPSNFVKPKKISKSGNYIVMTFNVPTGYANENGTGMTLKMTGLEAVDNNQTYKADDYSEYLSTYKIDTKGLDFSLKDEKGTAVTALDTYAQSQKFKLQISGGNPWIEKSKGKKEEGYFSYRLYESGNGGAEITLDKCGKTYATTAAAYSNSTVYTIKPANNKSVEGTYVLKINAEDFAGNKSNYETTVKLDNIAPRTTYTAKEVTAGTSRRIEYNFNIEEASQTGRVHYCFVENGNDMPSIGSDETEHSSGTTDTVYGRWAFINQKNVDAQTVVLNVAEGYAFNGKLYYYTSDDAGNVSDIKSVNINLNNESLECDLKIADYTPGLKSYDITFDTLAANTVTYHWINGDVTTQTVTYKNQDVGSATQLTGSGTKVTLNGECTLEYTVTTTTGNTKTYTKTFVFDNSNPEVGVTVKSDNMEKTATFGITASDVSSIKSLQYRIVGADGKNIKGYDVCELTAGLPELSTEVTIAPNETGAYMLWVKAVDQNGYSTETYSNVFCIRNTAPTVKTELKFDNNTKELDEKIVTSTQDYVIKIKTTEKVLNVGYFDDNQILMYRTSDDGVNYGSWVSSGTMSQSGSELYSEIEVTTPVAINSGRNSVFIQTAVVPRRSKADNISASLIATSEELVLYYDAEAPKYKFAIDDASATSGNLSATLTVTDEYTSAENISVLSMTGNMQLKTSEVVGDEKICKFTIYSNFENESIQVSDELGNAVQIPVTVNCIDRDAPTVRVESEYSEYRGDRVDYYVSFYVDEAVESLTKFALVEGYYDRVTTTPGTDGEMESTPITPNEIDDDLFLNENDEIEIISKETVNDYQRGETKTRYEVRIRALNKTGDYILAAYVEDSLGNNAKTGVGHGFYLYDAYPEINECTVPKEVGAQAPVTLNFNVPVFVLPQDKISEDYTDEEIEELTINTASEYSQTYSFLVDGYGTYTVYIVDECDRVVKKEVAITEDMVNFNEDYNISKKLYKGLDDDESHWEEVNIDTLEAIDCETDYYYYLVITPDENYTQTLYDTYIGDEYYYNSWNSSESKLVYEVLPTANTEKVLMFKSKTNELDGSEVERVGVFKLSLKDTTAPLVYVDYSTLNYTKDNVNAYLTFDDPELSVNPDKDAVGGENSGESYGEEEWAKISGIKDVRISDKIPVDDDFDNYADVAMKSVGAKTTLAVEFEENSQMLVAVENSVGLVRYKVLRVENISKNPITEDDFDVRYEYEDIEGNRHEAADGGYYKKVIAVLETTESGEEKGLYISNNMGSSEKYIDEYDNSFVFKVADKYGYTYDVDVSYNLFDLDGPAIEYTYPTTKTNQPIVLTVTATDEQAGIENVTVKKKNSDDNLITTTDTDENLRAVFTATISESGIYQITATDKLGNVSYKSFVVSNIDTSMPEIETLSYTTLNQTAQNVGVKLYYTKANVSLTNVEPVSGTSNSDVIVDYGSSIITFRKNGSVTAYFTDEYGNESNTVISVGNINRTPPALVAKTEKSKDLLSVKVTFEQEMNNGIPVDTTRNLEDLKVMYYGIPKVASEAEYEFIDNGKYTFTVYDEIGNVQVITLTIAEIDKAEPVVTQVSWSYDYYDDEGKLQKSNNVWEVKDEAGYTVADDIYKATNQNVTVEVTTDTETKFSGSRLEEYSLTHSAEYDKNGWFNFYLQRPNSMFTQYGVGIYLIDKEPPVIEGINDLIFYENPNFGEKYSIDMLKQYNAYDNKNGKKIDLTDKVTIDYGNFNPNNISSNTYDRTKPYEIVYSVKDNVGNETQVKRKVTLVGLFDTMVMINGSYPENDGSIEVDGGSVDVSLHNFSGKAYARYEKGYYTIGEMKNKGTVISEQNGSFKVENLESGWYTFYVQTDLRDYFCVQVYVNNE